MVGLAGVTAIDSRAAAVTVSVVEPLMLPMVALILELPVPLAVAKPAAVMVATVVSAEAQVTWVVRTCVELSEYVPVAVNCWVVPLAMLGLAGVRAIDSRAAAVTVSVVEPLMLPMVALILELPVPLAVAKPAAVMVATVVAAEAQVTWVVRTCVELSEYVPVAVNCWVVPLAMLGLAGVTAIDSRAA